MVPGFWSSKLRTREVRRAEHPEPVYALALSVLAPVMEKWPMSELCGKSPTIWVKLCGTLRKDQGKRVNPGLVPKVTF